MSTVGFLGVSIDQFGIVFDCTAFHQKPVVPQSIFEKIFLRHSWNSILNKKCDIKIFSLVSEFLYHVKYGGYILADAGEYLHTIMILIYGVNSCSVFISESASMSYLVLMKSHHCQLCIYNVDYSMGHFPGNSSNTNTHDGNK